MSEEKRQTNLEVLGELMKELHVPVVYSDGSATDSFGRNYAAMDVAATLAPLLKALFDKIDNLEHDLETAKLRSVATGLGVVNAAEVNVRALRERVKTLESSLDDEVLARRGRDGDLEARIERLEAGMAIGPMPEGQDLRPQVVPAPPQEVSPGVRAFEAVEAERLARLTEIQKEAQANHQEQETGPLLTRKSFWDDVWKWQEDRYARQQKRDALLERVVIALERIGGWWDVGQAKL